VSIIPASRFDSSPRFNPAVRIILLISTFREFPKRGSSPHVHDHDSRSRRWGDYWLELLGDSGFVPEDRLAAVKKETGELKGILVSIVVNTKAKSKNPKL
jgi:hypothetical protein